MSEEYVNLETALPFNHLDDSSFNLVLYELTHGSLNFDNDRFQSLLFNPIDQITHNSFRSYLDPDNNFSFCPPVSNYLVEEEFSNELTSSNNNISFSVMHLNTRSLLGNFDKFKTLLANLQITLPVIGISETWLSDLTSDQVNVPGYNFISNHRNSKTGGGTGLYLQDNLKYKLRPECMFSDPEKIESVFVEIEIPHGKNIIVGSIYRPPNQNVSLFVDKINEILGIISKDNKHCYVMGDFNLDLLHYNNHTPTQEFIDTLFSYAFYPLISKPTRVTSHSATLIDNIFTNQPAKCSHNAIILNDLSDHFPIVACFYEELPSTRDENIFRRSFNTNNLNKFRDLLSRIAWSNILNLPNVNDCYNIFINEYTRLFEICFPLKAVKSKHFGNSHAPWLTKGLLKSIKKKNRLYKLFIKAPNILRESRYKTYKNKLTHVLRKAKRLYYDSKFESAKSDLKLTWKLINEVISKRNNKPTMPSKLMLDNEALTNPTKIAERFCNYFTNIGPSLASKVPQVDSSFSSFLIENTNTPICLKLTDVNELRSICKSFKSGKAPGIDNIPIHIIKNCFDLIAEPLVKLVNLSLTTGVFPDKLKIAKVIPIFKTGDSDSVTNYRPISLLTSFSKIFEKVMHNRLSEFIERHDILYCCQFGFRKNHSTSLALTHLVNKITSAIDRKEVTAGVFLDLSKAFDTINHDILFVKLEHYGINGLALRWIKSYFLGRRQFVQFKDSRSSEQNIVCGIPQGSILGPLFFILYINDISNASTLTESLIFADDTSIFYSHSDPNVLESVINEELQMFDVWMKCNKLSVNIKKTNYVIFKSSKKKVAHNFCLRYGNEILKQEEATKFLGVYIDQHLTWKDHISHICKKISKSVGVIHRSRFYLLTKTKLSLYYTLIYPYITYCNIAWSSTYVTNINRIFYLQKRAVRAITNSNFRAHSAPLFLRLGILDIFKVNSLYVARFMFCYHNQLLPPIFFNLFTRNNQIHDYNTRSAINYRTHACRINLKKFTILYQGPKIWNSLPINIKNSISLYSFKKSMIEFLLR